VASARGSLITAQTLALQQETLLKNLIFRNVMDPRIAEISIVPTDQPDVTIQVPTISLEDAVSEANGKRPDVLQAVIDLDSKRIASKATRNALLPTLNLSAQYGTQGLGGNQITQITGPLIPGVLPIVDSTGTPVLVNGQQIFPASLSSIQGPTISGGLGDALRNVFQSNFPNYSVFLNLNFPFRNRAAQAANITAQLQQEQSAATLQRFRNAVAVDVRNAQIALQQDRAAVDANIRARILAEQTLDAEQKKFRLGVSTIFLVIQAERDLSTARSNEVRALANLAEAKVNFDRALGRTLEVSRIDIADNLHNKIDRAPLIPGTPSGELAQSTSGAKF
jgi:outer membrane protein TolC